MKAVVLAAGRGRRFGCGTKALPKCLVPLDGRGTHLLGRYLEAFRQTRIREVVIVVGHRKEKIKKECRRLGGGLRIRFVENPEYRRGSLVSLHRASKQLGGGTLIMDADVCFETADLRRLIRAPGGSAFLIDKASKSSGEEMMLMADGRRPRHISKRLVPGLRVLGEATGLFRLSPADAPLLRRILRRFYKNGTKNVEYEEAYCDLLKKTRIRALSVKGPWREMDFPSDRKKISSYLKKRRL